MSRFISITARIWAIAGLVLGLATCPGMAQTRRAQRLERRAQRRAERVQTQGNHSGQWLRRYKDLPADQRQEALENDPEFRRLPPERQQRLRERLLRFSNLPPQQQDRILQRMETWEHLNPEQKNQAQQLYSQLQGLPPERRRKLRTAIRDLRAMPPDQRQQVIDSARFKGQFSAHELDLLGSASRLPLAAPENSQSQPAPEE